MIDWNFAVHIPPLRQLFLFLRKIRFFFLWVRFLLPIQFFCLPIRTGCFLLLGVEILPSFRRLLFDKFFIGWWRGSWPADAALVVVVTSLVLPLRRDWTITATDTKPFFQQHRDRYPLKKMNSPHPEGRKVREREWERSSPSPREVKAWTVRGGGFELYPPPQAKNP